MSDKTAGDLLATFVQRADPELAASLRAAARCPGCGYAQCPRPREWSSLECDWDPDEDMRPTTTPRETDEMPEGGRPVSTAPEFGTEDYRRWAVLFNDITYAPRPHNGWFPFSNRRAMTDYLWAQGWRRDVRPEDEDTTPTPAAPSRRAEVNGAGDE